MKKKSLDKLLKHENILNTNLQNFILLDTNFNSFVFILK